VVKPNLNLVPAHPIEAYSRGAKLQGWESATACGIDLRAGATRNQRVRVTDKHGVQTDYSLDRWD
jgi:hypothetical protein